MSKSMLCCLLVLSPILLTCSMACPCPVPAETNQVQSGVDANATMVEEDNGNATTTPIPAWRVRLNEARAEAKRRREQNQADLKKIQEDYQKWLKMPVNQRAGALKKWLAKRRQERRERVKARQDRIKAQIEEARNRQNKNTGVQAVATVLEEVINSTEPTTSTSSSTVAASSPACAVVVVQPAKPMEKIEENGTPAPVNSAESGSSPASVETSGQVKQTGVVVVGQIEEVAVVNPGVDVAPQQPDNTQPPAATVASVKEQPPQENVQPSTQERKAVVEAEKAVAVPVEVAPQQPDNTNTQPPVAVAPAKEEPPQENVQPATQERKPVEAVAEKAVAVPVEVAPQQPDNTQPPAATVAPVKEQPPQVENVQPASQERKAAVEAEKAVAVPVEEPEVAVDAVPTNSGQKAQAVRDAGKKAVRVSIV